MAKKRDILSNYFNDFHKFKYSYQARLEELKRDFNNEKNEYQQLLNDISKDYQNDQDSYLSKYIKEENSHLERKTLIDDDYQERFSILTEELNNNIKENMALIEAENKLYQDILNQFEERKQEALNRYLQLIHESDLEIDESVDVHFDFIEEENKKTHNLKEYYQDINSFLANDLLNTMEKAKNSLDSLNDSLKETNINDSKELNKTVLESLEHLRGTQIGIISLFKENSTNLESQRESIKKISKNKQQPHSELNQEMIHKYVTQIRELNKAKIAFEAKVKSELEMSLARIYPKIIKAHDEKDNDNLEKYIYQKEIIEKKAHYLLHRNTTLTNFTISKYQQEIKKIKIDSFKRSEEIKLAYSLPIAFLQNSIDTYSNFAFYLNQGFDELDRLLNGLVDFNQDFFEVKNDFITTTSKAYEDYKINLIVRINEVTSNLTKLVSKIDDISLQIVTLESKNRLEVAEIRKKIQNLEILGDYQKYIASLENDEFFAMYQHNKNIERIQVESKYKENLLKINQDVLQLNKNRELGGEHLQYMINLSKEEDTIHKSSLDKLISEYKAFYDKQNRMSYLMYKIAKLQVTNQIKTKNYNYANRFVQIKNNELNKDQISSDTVVDYIHYMQKLINTNNTTTSAFKQYLTNSNNEMTYLTIVEKNRHLLRKEINDQFERKVNLCYQAASLYFRETHDLINKCSTLFNEYINKFKHLLIYNEESFLTYQAQIVQAGGYSLEISSLITYVYNKALNLAFKYQVPREIEKIAVEYNSTLINYNNLVVSVFDRLKIKTKTKVFYEKIQKYLINSLELLENYKVNMITSIKNIRDAISNNDILYIANAKIASEKNQEIIDKEYDSLAYEALNLKKKRKKQINSLLGNSNYYNEMFKKKVKNINDDYLVEKNKTTDFLEYIENEILKIIKKNDEQLLKMLKLIDKEIFEERLRFTEQYNRYLNTISSIGSTMKQSHEDEIKYLYDLSFKRESEILDTIALLETKIDSLPKEKNSILQTLDSQKQELFVLKQGELLQKFSEIEGNKLLSKPELQEEIQKVQKRLPEEYIKLYKEVQELENDFLQQYTLINENYFENYQDYINKQIANRLLLDKDGKMFKSFDSLNTYHQDLFSIFNLNLKEILQKSDESRDIIKLEKQKSKDKQDRVMNA